MKKLSLIFSLFIILYCPIYGAVQVVTTTTTLANIVSQIGGNRVQVQSFSQGGQDTHQVTAKPSMVMKAKQADVIFLLGMDLDDWVYAIIETSRSKKFFRGSDRLIDVSKAISLKKDIPKGFIDGRHGDIHIHGNPHYLYDPTNGILVAKLITSTLTTLDPAGQDYYENNFQSFQKSLISLTKKLKSNHSISMISYHDSLPYFSDYFEISIIGMIEPKPGISPSPGHLSQLKALGLSKKSVIVVSEPWQNQAIAKSVAKAINAPLVIFWAEVGSHPKVSSYQDIFLTFFEQLKTN